MSSNGTSPSNSKAARAPSLKVDVSNSSAEQKAQALAQTSRAGPQTDQSYVPSPSPSHAHGSSSTISALLDRAVKSQEQQQLQRQGVTTHTDATADATVAVTSPGTRAGSSTDNVDEATTAMSPKPQADASSEERKEADAGDQKTPAQQQQTEKAGVDIGTPGLRSEEQVRLLKAQLKTTAKRVLETHTGYDLMPPSGKVVVFDSRLSILHAFVGLEENKLKGAPVWDSDLRKFTGMVTVTDFIDIILYAHSAAGVLSPAPTYDVISPTLSSSSQRPFSPAENAAASASSPPPLSLRTGSMTDSGELLRDPHEEQKAARVTGLLMGQCIRDWAMIKRRQGASLGKLLYIYPGEKLVEAVSIMSKHRIHRLCVLEESPGNSVLCVLTMHRLARFLLHEFSGESFLSLTAAELAIGTFGLDKVYTVTYDTPLLQVLKTMAIRRISGVPVVNADGVAVDIYSRSDVRFLTMDSTYDITRLSVGDTLTKHKFDRPVPICTLDDTLETLLKRLIATGKHRLICVDQDRKVQGLISMSDIIALTMLGARPTHVAPMGDSGGPLGTTFSRHNPKLSTQLNASALSGLTSPQSPFSPTPQDEPEAAMRAKQATRAAKIMVQPKPSRQSRRSSLQHVHDQLESSATPVFRSFAPVSSQPNDRSFAENVETSDSEDEHEHYTVRLQPFQ